MAEIRTAIPGEVDAYLDALVQKGVFSNKAELVRAALVSYVNATGTFFQGFDAENVFAPDGRLYQVEYARESAARGGTAAGIVCEDGVLLTAEIPGKSKLTAGGKKIQSLGEHLAVVFSGLVGDAALVVDELRSAEDDGRGGQNHTEHASPIYTQPDSKASRSGLPDREPPRSETETHLHGPERRRR